MSVAAGLREHGWCLTTGSDLSWPEPQAVQAAFAAALAPDPRGPGKQHARDVVSYRLNALTEAASIAFTTEAGKVIDDFSRFRLLDQEFGWFVVGTVLGMVPAGYARHAGAVSADYFRYSAGAGSPAHRDGFAEYVVIWALERSGDGGESFLLRDGGVVFEQALEAGQVLVFRDDLFLHGVKPVHGGGACRDVLILSTVRP